MVAAYLGIGSKTKPAEMEPSPLTFPIAELGPTRPLSTTFGPAAVDQMREMWAQYERAKAAR